VRIYGEWVAINAQVANLATLSAHADAEELLRWAKGFQSPPKKVFVVHGEPQPADTLRSRLDHEFGWEAIVSRRNQVVEL
jgi:metallo-beta-lactamase family protein